MKIITLAESHLKKQTPYMLRNDGKLFDCSHLTAHPYLIGFGEINTKNDFYEYLKNSLSDEFLQWFYKNTNHMSTKKLIKIFVNFLVNNSETKKIIQPYVENFNITGNEKEITLPDAISIFKELEAELNQEFLRARTSDMYYGGSGKDIYFRVSSTGFNWFDLIWNLIYENKDFITSVTIATDPSSHKSEEEKFYSHKGQEFDHMPTEEFITLSGNPVVESLSLNKKRLAEGYSLYDAFNHTRPDRIYQYYRKLMANEFETREM